MQRHYWKAKGMHKFLALIILCVSLPLSVNAGNDWIAIAKLSIQIKHQLEMLRSLPSGDWQGMADMSGQLEQVIQQSKELSNTLANMNNDFDKNYHADTDKYNASESQKATLNTLHESLNQMQGSIGLMARQKQLLSQLSRSSRNSVGQKQALQTANQIALEDVQQLQNMQRILAAQAKAQMAYQAQKEAEAHYQEDTFQKIMNNIPSKYESKSSSTILIPDIG